MAFIGSNLSIIIETTVDFFRANKRFFRFKNPHAILDTVFVGTFNPIRKPVLLLINMPTKKYKQQLLAPHTFHKPTEPLLLCKLWMFCCHTIILLIWIAVFCFTIIIFLDVIGNTKNLGYIIANIKRLSLWQNIHRHKKSLRYNFKLI